MIDLKGGLELAIGNLNTTLGNMQQTLSQIHKFLAPNPRQSPIVRPFAGAVTSDGSTYITIGLGGPAGGRLWDVRRLAIWKGIVDPFAVVSNVTVMFVVMNAAPPNRGFATIPAFVDVILSPGAIPNDVTWQAHQATIRHPQQLVAVIKGSSSADNYICTGQAEEYIESMPETVVM